MMTPTPPLEPADQGQASPQKRDQSAPSKRASEPQERMPDPVLQPQDAPGDVPDFSEEYTTMGTDKRDWETPGENEPGSIHKTEKLL